jgi:glycosyltransferase involved in cell wall biosynthesis
MVIHLPWAPDLGGTRPQYDLTASLRQLGHEVDHYSLDDAFHGQPRTRLGALMRRPFRNEAVSAIRSVANDYDIIDANQGDLPCSKAELGFDGLLVLRSNGLIPEYRRFERWAATRWRERRGRLLGRLVRRMQALSEARAVEATYRFADVIVVPNPTELDQLEQGHAVGHKVRVIPLGVRDSYVQAVETQALESDRRLGCREVVFIGTWDVRKGSEDWPAIMRAVLSVMSDVRFRFLGTAVEPAGILRAVGADLASRTVVVPRFAAEHLPSLLADSTVGALPSYIEAFGLGVLEQLAAGVPTIAYDVPGPRQTLAPFAPNAVTFPGDTCGFAKRLLRVLNAEAHDYRTLALRSRARAQELPWSRTVSLTLMEYQAGLERLRQLRRE